jgi:hypothetical protein
MSYSFQDKGILVHAMPQVTCPRCEGAKEIQCPNCKGLGERFGLMCLRCVSRCEITCPRCKGGGTVSKRYKVATPRSVRSKKAHVTGLGTVVCNALPEFAPHGRSHRAVERAP